MTMPGRALGFFSRSVPEASGLLANLFRALRLSGAGKPAPISDTLLRAMASAFRKNFPRSFFKEIPDKPGVYFMRDERGRILYIGKAKSLPRRLRSYRNAKPGKVGDNIIQLLKRVRKIDWETHPTEKLAIHRERELIHALTPPYNLADCWTEDYLYIAWRASETGRLHFRLTGREDDEFCEGYEIFGCFRHRRKTKDAYSALLRLFYAAFNLKPRTSFPSRITRESPAYEYALPMRLPEEAMSLLRDFLSGLHSKLLPWIVERLLENESIPAFFRPGLQDDLSLVHDFYETCARPNFRSRAAVVSHSELRRRIRASVS